MNDGSYISRFALSLSLKNMTTWPWAESTFPKRASDLFVIWNEPHNVSYIMHMLKRYNVSYIFSTSERFLVGQGRSYYSRPYDPKVYAQIFDEYHFLEALYMSGSARIYKVVQTDLDPLSVRGRSGRRRLTLTRVSLYPISERRPAS